jgi:hypothetical protein
MSLITKPFCESPFCELCRIYLRDSRYVQEGLKVLRKEVVPNGDPEVPLPVNLNRLVSNARSLFGEGGGGADFGPQGPAEEAGRGAWQG